LTYRGEANKDEARKYILDLINKNGKASVYCLNDTIQQCTSQVGSLVGPLHAVGSTPVKDGVFKLDFVEKASFLDFQGDSFLNLPSQISSVGGTQKIIQQQSGFLVYGPYTTIKSGNYSLNVSGSSEYLVDAYVEIVSAKGSNLHAKFMLEQLNDGYLLKNGLVNLEEDVSDLEVRVWVSKKDKVNLFGYSLKPLRRGGGQ
jgi:hypothetical protein